jgi:hypothetical protein
MRVLRLQLEVLNGVEDEKSDLAACGNIAFTLPQNH